MLLLLELQNVFVTFVKHSINLHHRSSKLCFSSFLPCFILLLILPFLISFNVITFLFYFTNFIYFIFEIEISTYIHRFRKKVVASVMERNARERVSRRIMGYERVCEHVIFRHFFR